MSLCPVCREQGLYRLIARRQDGTPVYFSPDKQLVFCGPEHASEFYDTHSGWAGHNRRKP